MTSQQQLGGVATVGVMDFSTAVAGRGDDAVTPTSRDKGAFSLSFSLLSVLKWKSALKHELYMLLSSL